MAKKKAKEGRVISLFLTTDLGKDLDRYLSKNSDTDASKTIRIALRQYLVSNMPEEPKRSRVKTA